MNRILVIFIGAILNTWISIYACSILLGEKINYNDGKFWGLQILISFYLGGIYLITDNYIKIVISFLLLIFACIVLFKATIIKSAASAFFVLLINLLSEVFYLIMLVYFFGINLEKIHISVFGNIWSNLCIFIYIYVILAIKPIRKIIKIIISNVDSKKNKSIIIFALISMLTVSMLVYYIYFEISLIWTFIICLLFIGIYAFLTITIFCEKSECIRLQTEYEITLNNLNEYEKMYEYQRLLNHEYKNNLLVIRGLTSKNNKILLDFIDEILNIKEKESKKWMTNLKRIPEGGLRGLLYFKLILMEEKNCNIEFFIGKKFKTKDYKNLSNCLKQNICKILGIYLDNSMQALEKVKNRNIAIRIDGNDNKVIIVIINNFEENIDLDKIYNRGYSTKEKGRGYGLAIVKEILERESKIINKTSIIGSNFCQELQIKM